MGGLSHTCWVAGRVGLASSNTHNPVGGLGHGLIPAQPAQLPCLVSGSVYWDVDVHCSCSFSNVLEQITAKGDVGYVEDAISSEY